jgi:hypothetical protein
LHRPTIGRGVAGTDIVLTETFVRTIELLNPITIWIQPATLKRIVGSRRKARL